MVNKKRSVNTPYGLLPSHTVMIRTPLIMAGELNARCLLQAPNTTPLPSGNIPQGWTTIDTIWASIYPLHGAVVYQDEQQGEETTNWMRIRYRTDVHANMRLVTDAEQYVLTRMPLDIGYKHSVLLLFAKRRLKDTR